MNSFSISNFEKMFGVFKDKFLSYLFLCIQYYIYVCKFQNKKPNVISCKTFIKTKRHSEYLIAKKKGKLSAHFKKWRFDFWFIHVSCPIFSPYWMYVVNCNVYIICYLLMWLWLKDLEYWYCCLSLVIICNLFPFLFMFYFIFLNKKQNQKSQSWLLLYFNACKLYWIGNVTINHRQ